MTQQAVSMLLAYVIKVSFKLTVSVLRVFPLFSEGKHL